MCLTPLTLKSPKKHGQTVPCGRCSECLGLKRQDWFYRLDQEALNCISPYFITLTYSDEYLTYGDYEHALLIYADIQKYLKRLRKEGCKFKYFAVGEYGEKSLRPHFHLLLFDHGGFNHELFEKQWTFGQSSFYVANAAMIKYCTKDMLKEVDLFNEYPRQIRPHLLCSKGLGISYVDMNKKWHEAHPYKRVKMTNYAGSTHMPRYYRIKIFNEEQRNVQRIISENNRCNADSLSKNCNDEALKKLHHEAKIYSQKVEYLRKQQLKINHLKRL